MTLMTVVTADSPTGPAASYGTLITSSLQRDYPAILKPPTGSLAYPFITPGGDYAAELWDWDSWLGDVGLSQIVADQHPAGGTSDALKFGEGCVLNFLSASSPDGIIPIILKADADPKSFLPAPGFVTNMHKPVLAQHAAFLCRLNGGNAEWLRPRFSQLQAFLKNYRDHSWDMASGLYFWQDDVAIGVDNDPCTFYRPRGSSGSILLNCLMYRELLAMAYLSSCLRLPDDIGVGYAKQAAELKAAVQENCWDERDGFYYSVDLDLLPVHRPPEQYLGMTLSIHSGHPRAYSCLIQRIEVWSGFAAMWAGIATPEQARRMVGEHLKNPRTFAARYGVRSLSKMEKMYGIYFSSNPSNWNGPVWGIANYMVFRGLVAYGFDAEAKDMADRTIELFGQDYARTGMMHESYDPDTGAPLGHALQGWNYLVANILAWREGRPVVGEF